VIAHRGGHLQVVACAGAGKTEAISRRVAALIEEGVEPSQIVAFTFTERAAEGLKTQYRWANCPLCCASMSACP
jgi:DNA helicase-2/ATP-dependent DNA helicase PcrA